MGPTFRRRRKADPFGFRDKIRTDCSSGAALSSASCAKRAQRQPVEGGPYQQVTMFTTTVLSSFRWSPDGKMLYVTRGTRSADIVLLRDTK